MDSKEDSKGRKSFGGLKGKALDPCLSLATPQSVILFFMSKTKSFILYDVRDEKNSLRACRFVAIL